MKFLNSNKHSKINKNTRRHQLYSLFEINGGNYIFFILFIITLITYFSHDFLPNYNESYYLEKSNFEKLKKENTKALKIIKDITKDTPEYKSYIQVNNRKNKAYKELLIEIEQNKLYGFKSIKFFLEKISFIFLIFIYALFYLYKSLKWERHNIGSILIHTQILAVCFFNFFWIFQRFQNVSKITYLFMSIFSGGLTSLAFYFFSKYRKGTFQKLEEENKKAIESINRLEKEVLIKQEEQRAEERQRISEELHDGVLGKLFGTRMGLGFLDLSKNESKEKYLSFLDELQEIEKEIREVSHKLNTNLNGLDIGFLQIVKQLFIDRSKLHGFSYSIHSDKSIDWNIVNEIDKVNLYRIIQESLQNTIKHARAKNVNLFLNRENNGVLIKIEDDGNGFDTSKSKTGIGLKNIQSRVKRLNGKFIISSELNKGTVLNIQIPIREKLTKEL